MTAIVSGRARLPMKRARYYSGSYLACSTGGYLEFEVTPGTEERITRLGIEHNLSGNRVMCLKGWGTAKEWMTASDEYHSTFGPYFADGRIETEACLPHILRFIREIPAFNEPVAENEKRWELTERALDRIASLVGFDPTKVQKKHASPVGSITFELTSYIIVPPDGRSDAHHHVRKLCEIAGIHTRYLMRLADHPYKKEFGGTTPMLDVYRRGGPAPEGMVSMRQCIRTLRLLRALTRQGYQRYDECIAACKAAEGANRKRLPELNARRIAAGFMPLSAEWTSEYSGGLALVCTEHPTKGKGTAFALGDWDRLEEHLQYEIKYCTPNYQPSETTPAA